MPHFLFRVCARAEAFAGIAPGGLQQDLITELTDKFGSATSFVRAPGQGLWDSGGDVERDNIAVIEVMTLVRESLATASR